MDHEPRPSLRKAAHSVLLSNRSSSVLAHASDDAVSMRNIPGHAMDEIGDSPAAKAARALQEAIRGGDASTTGSASVSGGAMVTAHAPEVFRRIRHHFGRSEEAYAHVLAGEPLRLVGEEEAAGKSDAFFVFTGDGRYCVKSVAASEARELRRIVERYEAYVSEHPTTLLPRFYGLYEVALPSASAFRRPLRFHLMVQGNVLGGRAGCGLRFDLKGATHGECCCCWLPVRQAGAWSLAGCGPAGWLLAGC